MKHIYVNLKRFDVPAALGGVNRIAPPAEWARYILQAVQAPLQPYEGTAEFTFFFPEAHLLAAAAACDEASPVQLGCQGVYRDDISPGGNFGAFTTNRPAAAARALGCTATIIGHCEERRALAGVLAEAGVNSGDAVGRILAKEAASAARQGLRVLFCIGENEEEQANWQAVLANQLDVGLSALDEPQRQSCVIAYEPVWAIGPGKTPPGSDYIQTVARFIKEHTGGLAVVYGGGLKADNAASLAAIPEIDGGLIALTRFAGDIGFYPEEYLEIVRLYMGAS